LSETGKSVKRAIADNVVVPLVAAGASALAAYIAKKAPSYVERARDGGADALGSVAKSAVSGTGDVAEGLVDRVREVSGRVTNEAVVKTRMRGGLSTSELARRRMERDKHRAARRRAS
jgi:hypothetical protein